MSFAFLRSVPALHCLVHPDAPCDRPGLFICDRVARQLEGQLDLAVMVSLMPDHVLQQKDWVIVVKVHLPARLYPALYGVPHGFWHCR